MQIVDTILWWNEIHGAGGAGGLAACDLTNRMATRAGLCIICLEPMAAMLGAHLIAVSPSFFCFSLSISLSLSCLGGLPIRPPLLVVFPIQANQLHATQTCVLVVFTFHTRPRRIAVLILWSWRRTRPSSYSPPSLAHRCSRTERLAVRLSERVRRNNTRCIIHQKNI